MLHIHLANANDIKLKTKKTAIRHSISIDDAEIMNDVFWQILIEKKNKIVVCFDHQKFVFAQIKPRIYAFQK